MVLAAGLCHPEVSRSEISEANEVAAVSSSSANAAHAAEAASIGPAPGPLNICSDVTSGRDVKKLIAKGPSCLFRLTCGGADPITPKSWQ